MSRAAARVLVVDDETQMLSIVSFALETQGFETVCAKNAEQAWPMLRAGDFDLVVLDVTLPGASGVELCRRIRLESDVPVLMLTARAEEPDRIAGLVAGADDYLTKPFSPRELALRAQAIVRRAKPRSEADNLVRNGDLVIDVDRRQARWQGTLLPLSDVELRLLTTLARRPGQTVGWSEMLNEVWHTSEHVGARDLVKTTVHRLRGHLRGVELVASVRGQGYLMPLLERCDDDEI